MSQMVEYPTDHITTEYRDLMESGGFCDGIPRRVLQFKHTLPSIPQTKNKRVWYELRTALVLQQVTIRNDLESIFHRITLKGIGSSSHQHEKSNDLMSETAEVAFDRIGIGSVQGAVRRWFNKFYGIDDSIKHHVDLKKDDVDYGDMSVSTFVLNDASYMQRNGFPMNERMNVPDDASVILSTINASMSRKEMEQIFNHANRVPTRYGNAPRPIIRVDYPHSLFINRDTPTISMHTALRSSEHPDYVHTQMRIELEPLERNVTKRDATSASLSATQPQ